MHERGPFVYLDHASAAPWHPAALAAYAQVAATFPADPARHHSAGRKARDVLEQARSAVAATFGAPVAQVAFTSGGTEAIHLAVRGAVAANRTRARRILSAAVEHSAVLAAADAAVLAPRAGAPYEHVRLRVDEYGRVELDALEQELVAGAALVNLQHANHEVGTMQPVVEAARLCREADALVHVDACQSAGRIPVTLEALGADFLSLSGAKFGGGRGTGALVWSERARFFPLLTGDEREHRRRAGLEHLPGVAAMAETLLHLRPAARDGHAALESARCDALRRLLRDRLARIEDVQVHGDADEALPHIAAVSALYVDGQTLVETLSEAGFGVHSGSSCTSTSGEPSHVLVAMGALTHGHVRVSVGADVSEEDVLAFTVAFERAIARLRARIGRQVGR